VFCNPPPQFPFPDMDLHSIWYGRVLLFFKVLVQTDSDLLVDNQATEYELAFIDFFTSARLPAHLNRRNRIMLYAPMPQPRVYVIPCADRHILGSLPVVPAGDTGTITSDMPTGWFDGDIRRSTPAKPNGGSAIWYVTVNEWALRWATSEPPSRPVGGPGAERTCDLGQAPDAGRPQLSDDSESLDLSDSLENDSDSARGHSDAFSESESDSDAGGASASNSDDEDNSDA
jgi:hypothetical protein